MSDEISLIITNTTTFVKGRLKSDIYQGLKRKLGYMPTNAFFTVKYLKMNPEFSKKPWLKNYDGHITTVCYNKAKCRCTIKKEGTHFPTGLVSKAIEYFKSKYVNCKVYDKRTKVEPSLSLSINEEKFELRDYQKDVIDKALYAERGIIKMATGGGKTPTVAGIISKANISPFVFYVTSKDLLKQAKSELQKFVLCNGSHLDVGVIGDGQCDIKDINVMTVQTAVRACGMKYKKFDDEEESKEKGISEKYRDDIKNLITCAKGIYVDECHHVRSESCQIISDMSVNARLRYGGSATPYRDESDDILIESCFGRNICDINASFLINAGYLIKPDVYFVPINNMRGRGFGTYVTAYKKAIVKNSVRNDIIVKVAEQFVNNGRVILILCRYIEHGKMLEKLIPGSVFLHGAHSSKKRKEHLDKIRKRKASVTISSIIFDEGIDVKPLDTLILAGSGKSATRALQRIGRILRTFPGKDEATVIDFMDNCKYMLSHSKRRKKIYKTEPEFNIDQLSF